MNPTEKKTFLQNKLNQKIDNLPRDLLELLTAQHDIPLNIGLARKSELVFKSILLQKITNKYPSVSKVWSRLLEESVFHFEELTINLDSWVSSVQEGCISLGGLSIPQNSKDQMMFFDQKFDYEKEIIWKFSHELSHIVAHNLVRDNQGIQNFFNNTVLPSRNSSQGYGLSLIGSLPFYKDRGGTLEQATEDITELINMYLLDSDYLLDSLILLRDMGDDWLQKYKLLRLDDNGIIFIFNTIKQGIDSRIK